jgi:hypothetical protein
MASGIPVFDELPNQAGALAAIHAYERFRHSRAAGVPQSRHTSVLETALTDAGE